MSTYRCLVLRRQRLAVAAPRRKELSHHHLVLPLARQPSFEVLQAYTYGSWATQLDLSKRICTCSASQHCAPHACLATRPSASPSKQTTHEHSCHAWATHPSGHARPSSLRAVCTQAAAAAAQGAPEPAGSKACVTVTGVAIATVLLYSRCVSAGHASVDYTPISSPRHGHHHIAECRATIRPHPNHENQVETRITARGSRRAAV